MKLQYVLSTETCNENIETNKQKKITNFFHVPTFYSLFEMKDYSTKIHETTTDSIVTTDPGQMKLSVQMTSDFIFL